MSAAFIVVPKPVGNGRHTMWEVIDTEAAQAKDSRSNRRARLGAFDDEYQARALAATLNGAAAPYRAELRRLDDAGEPF